MIVASAFTVIYTDYIKFVRKAYAVWLNVVVYRSKAVDSKRICVETEVLQRYLCNARDLLCGLVIVSFIIQILYLAYYEFININDPLVDTPELKIFMAITVIIMAILLLVELCAIAHIGIDKKEEFPFIRRRESLDYKLYQVWRDLKCKDLKDPQFAVKRIPPKFYEYDDKMSGVMIKKSSLFRRLYEEIVKALHNHIS